MQKRIYSFECPCCFLIFEEEHEIDELISYTPEKMCEYCKLKPWLMVDNLLNAHSLQLLKRRMEVLDKTRLHRFPTIIKHLFEHIVLEDTEID